MSGLLHWLFAACSSTMIQSSTSIGSVLACHGDLPRPPVRLIRSTVNLPEAPWLSHLPQALLARCTMEKHWTVEKWVKTMTVCHDDLRLKAPAHPHSVQRYTREETTDVQLWTTRINDTPPRARRLLLSDSDVQKVSPEHLWTRASSASLIRSQHLAKKVSKKGVEWEVFQHFSSMKLWVSLVRQIPLSWSLLIIARSKGDVSRDVLVARQLWTLIVLLAITKRTLTVVQVTLQVRKKHYNRAHLARFLMMNTKTCAIAWQRLLGSIRGSLRAPPSQSVRPASRHNVWSCCRNASSSPNSS